MAPRVGEAPLSFLNLCRPTSERNFAAGPEPAPAGAAESRQAGHCRLRSTQFRSSRPLSPRAACLAARASRKQLQQWPGQDAISWVRQWLCILCCRTDLGEQHPVHPEVVKDEAAGCRAHSIPFVAKPTILLINKTLGGGNRRFC